MTFIGIADLHIMCYFHVDTCETVSSQDESAELSPVKQT